MKLIALKLFCRFWYAIGIFADRLLVRPIPNAIWRLQMPGCSLYQFAMRRSVKLDDEYGLGVWEWV